jgi:hypothetical protein
VPPLGVGDGELGNKPVLDVDVLYALRCCMCPYEAITVYSFPKYPSILHLLGLSTITRYVPVFLNSVSFLPFCGRFVAGLHLDKSNQINGRTDGSIIY